MSFTISRLAQALRQVASDPWAEGDLLLSAHLTRIELGRLANRCRRTTLSLRERERVAREIPPERRGRHAWSVYRAVIVVPEPARWELLDSREHWTYDEMELAVQDWKRLHGSAPGPYGP